MRFGAGMLVRAAAGCRCKVRQEWRVRFGAGLLAPLHWPLQNAAVRLSVLFGAWLLRVSLQGASRQGAAARCCRQWNLVAQGRCKVPVEGAASRCVLSECCLRFGAWLLVLLQGVAVQRRTFELDCWCCGRCAPRFVSVIPL